MKNIVGILSLAMVLGFLSSGGANAQSKQQRDTVVFVTSMHCNNCVKRVEGSIPFEKGVKDISVDLKAKSVTVIYDHGKTDTENLLKAFGKIKMEAEVVQEKEGVQSDEPIL